MAPHEIERGWRERLAGAVPFGLLSRKPRHFRDMAAVTWKNRDNLGYAWKVLSKGVCDGCALGVAGFHDWTIEGVHLCMTRLNLLRLNTMPPMDPEVLADVSALEGLSNEELREKGRLAHPMLRKKGERGFARITWDEALALSGARLRAARPDRLAFFLTSRGITNEVYYVAQKAARFLGTNNVDNAARLCHAPSTAAMKGAIGVSASTCSYADWIGTDLIVFFGSNPANDQPVTTKYLHAAKAKGTKVVLVNPYKEPGMDRYWVPSVASSALFGTDIADFWFPVAQGGDTAFLYGVLKVLVEEGWVDRSFIDSRSSGFDELAARARELDIERLEKDSGLSRESFRQFAELVRNARRGGAAGAVQPSRGILVWSMGITQHAFGADGVRMILNLGLSQGWVGRDGCGLVPIRGHSGVQGGAEMGAYATAFPGPKPIDEANAAELSRVYGFPVPGKPGLSAVEMIDAAGHGGLDVLWSVGGNFLRTLPQPEMVRAALRRVPFRVHQDILVNDQMLVEGDEVLLLPAQTRYEQEGGGTETSTERRVMFSPEIPRAVGEARAEWRILREAALAAYPDRAPLLRCESGPSIRAEIARIVPMYQGIETLGKTGDAFQYGEPHLCVERFPTPDGKAHFSAPELPGVAREAGAFWVSTRRGKQFNTLVYADVDPLNGAARDAVLMSPEDAARLSLESGDRLVLTSAVGRFEGRVLVSPIAPGNLQVHFPEGNTLLASGVVDEEGGVPDYNARVVVERLSLEAP